MKAIFIAFDQAYYERIIEMLQLSNCRGFTGWQEVQGRGSNDGEPHYGTHAWPTLNSAMLIFLPDDKVEPLLKEIHLLDESAPQQGIHAFVMPAEER